MHSFSTNSLTTCPLFSSRPVSYPENHFSLSPAGGDRGMVYRNPSASFSSPSSGLVGLATIGSPGMTPGGPFVRYKPSPDRWVHVRLLGGLLRHLLVLDSTRRTWLLTTVFIVLEADYVGLNEMMNNVARLSLQREMCKHTVSQRKDLLCGWLFLSVWRLITSHPTRKSCSFNCQQYPEQKLKISSSNQVLNSLTFLICLVRIFLPKYFVSCNQIRLYEYSAAQYITNLLLLQ